MRRDDRARRAGWLPAWAALVFGWLLCGAAAAHEVRPAYLEIRETAPGEYDVLWKVPVVSGGRLGVSVSLPAGVEGVGERRLAVVSDAVLERWSVRCEGGLAGREIRIAGLSSTAVDVLVRVEHLDGGTQVARLTPARTSVVVEASPGALGVAWAYLVLGVEHILLGVDHLLFVLALLLAVRSARVLLGTVTMFTVAHSVTLALATLGVVRVPGGPVEATIALSIVFVAAEIVRGREGREGLTARAPWVVAFTFGLLHGLGFAGALSEVGLPERAVPVALLLFNVGVEVGQLAFIAGAVGVGLALRRLPVRAPAWGWRVLPYAIGSVAMFWVVERVGGIIA